MQSSFSLPQKNVLNGRPCNDRDQFRSAILLWVVSTYNHCSRQRAHGKRSPSECEALIGFKALAVAA
jgi:hypothetical protein